MLRAKVSDCSDDSSNVNLAPKTFFLRYVDTLEKRIQRAGDLDSIDSEVYDFIFTIFDQCDKLMKLNCKIKSDVIRNLATVFNLTSVFANSYYEFNSTNHLTYASKCEKLESTAENDRTSRLKLLCDVCEEEFPVINDDLQYSYQLHFNSEYHADIASFHRHIQETTSLSATISESEKSFLRYQWIKDNNQSDILVWRLNSHYYCNLCDVSLYDINVFDAHVSAKTHKIHLKLKLEAGKTNNSNAEFPQAESLSSEQSSIRDVHPSTTTSASEKSFDRFQWIKDNNQSGLLTWCWDSYYYCILCSCILSKQDIFDRHVNGQIHRENLELRRGNNSSKLLNKETCEEIPVKNWVESNVIVAMKGKLMCCICLKMLRNEISLHSHKKSNAHRVQIKSYLMPENSKFDVLRKFLDNNTNGPIMKAPKKVSLNRETKCDVIYSVNGRWLCTLCECFFLEKNDFLSHTSSSLHKKKLNLPLKTVNQTSRTFTRSASNSANNFIVIRNKIPYCRLCNAQLPGKSQLEGHLNGSFHKSQLSSFRRAL